MCMLTLTSVKFDSQSRTRWCLSTLILNNDCTRTHERAGERASERVTERATEWTDEQASARKMTYDKYNNNNNNKWIVLGWACKQSVELCSTQTCVRCWHTHTRSHTDTNSLWVFEICQFWIRISLQARTWQTRASKQRNKRAHILASRSAPSLSSPHCLALPRLAYHSRVPLLFHVLNISLARSLAFL